ncbi:hypothetical protein BDV11DRAFT_189138 [Aspergillus similis]
MVALHLKNRGISKQATVGMFPIFLICLFLGVFVNLQTRRLQSCSVRSSSPFFMGTWLAGAKVLRSNCGLPGFNLLWQGRGYLCTVLGQTALWHVRMQLFDPAWVRVTWG